MLKMSRAMRVTEDCIREVGKLFPAADNPIDPEDDLISLKIDNALISRLISKIATDKKFGLESLVPKYKINQNIFAIDEDSTVYEVARTVYRNAVLV